MVAALGLTATDSCLSGLPFNYAFGSSILHTHVCAGATVIVAPSLAFPLTVVDRLMEARPTGLYGVPSTFTILLTRTDVAGRNTSFLRFLAQAGGPMAGILLYTAAAESEGTLVGLVSLGQPDTLGRLLDQALDTSRLCASDPLCAEHHPWRDGATLHGAACHACMFVPETSCERGNRYLDRSVLVPTIQRVDLALFDTGW